MTAHTDLAKVDVRVEVRDVSARGIRIRLHEAGDGPPLVLVHGFLANRHTWNDVLPMLAKKFRVVAVDLPGFGASEKPPVSRFPYTFDAFAEALVDVTAALKLSRVTVVGHAMGGAIALSLVARHPSVLDRLVLVDPLVYSASHGVLLEASALPVVGSLVFKQLYGRAAFRSFFAYYGEKFPVPWTRVDEFFGNFGTPAAREGAHATLLSMLDTRSIVALLPRVTLPTLVVWGREDRRYPSSFARKLAREIADSRLEILQTGHFPHEESPEAFASLVTEFLRGRRSQRVSAR